MENTEIKAESNVLDFAEWNERLREQRALEEARKAAEERDRRMNLLLQEFRS
jgi:HD superfamily phosphodiesterase